MIGDTCFWMIVVKDPLTNVGSWPGDFQILWKSFRPPLERGGQLKVFLCVIKYNHAGFPRLYRAFFRASRLAPKRKITATELDNTYNIYDMCWNVHTVSRATIRIYRCFAAETWWLVFFDGFCDASKPEWIDQVLFLFTNTTQNSQQCKRISTNCRSFHFQSYWVQSYWAQWNTVCTLLLDIVWILAGSDKTPQALVEDLT